MARITDKWLNARIKRLAAAMGVSVGHYRKGPDGKYAPVPHALEMYHAYGRKSVHQLGASGTGVRDLSGLLNGPQLDAWLDGAIAAAEQPRGQLTRAQQAHVDYLRETLIPDLRDSGSDFMADDFQRCLDIIASLTGGK